MDWFERLIKDIKELRIQGAENVARAAVKGLARVARESVDLEKAAKRLAETRPTEPMLRNAINYFLTHSPNEGAEKTVERLLRGFDEDGEKIGEYAVALMREGATYQTHCHSSTVVRAFLKAKEKGLSFSVHTTETRPLYQGRMTAKQLAKAGIPVDHYVDSGARVALKGCDAVFLGADALLSDANVANKIGSEMIAELAFNRNIPVYILATSWKYDTATHGTFKQELEERDPAELWKGAPKGIKVNNFSFELIHPKYITAIITEFGIRDPFTAAKELKERQAWLFPTEKKR